MHTKTDRRNCLSVYVLTHNSERHLDGVLTQVGKFADELVVVDSGSSDSTRKICQQHGAVFVQHELKNFRSQRAFATNLCTNDWVMAIDSDEIPDNKLVATIRELKRNSFLLHGISYQAFFVARHWYVGEERIHALYPVQCPDQTIRLFRKDVAKLHPDTVHEKYYGFENIGVLDMGYLHHFTIDDLDELEDKLDQYTEFAANDADRKDKIGTWSNIILHSACAFLKYYLVKGNWKDGWAGITLANYAARYTYRKYFYLKTMQQLLQQSPIR